MSKIVGEQELIEKARRIPPGDPRSQINWELINELPDMFEAHIVSVKFNLADDFTNVGTKKSPKYYPDIDLMYRIANATGINAHGKSIVEPIYEEVNVSEMEMADHPVIMKKKVGYMVTKQASVKEGDGDNRLSSPRTGIENAWEYCQKLWTKEEESTEGYTKISTDKYGNKGFTYVWEGREQFKKLMHDTKWKRRKAFQERIDKAMGMADSKAWGKCVREIMGMPTGYEAPQLKDGELYFAKICRSKSSLKLEQAAHLQRIANGGQSESVGKLYGSQPHHYEPDPAPQPEDTYEHSAEPEPEPTQPPPQKQDTCTKRELLIWLFEQYQAENMIPQASAEGATTCLNWLKGTPAAEQVPKFWNRSIELMQSIEKQIPAESRIEHGPL